MEEVKEQLTPRNSNRFIAIYIKRLAYFINLHTIRLDVIVIESDSCKNHFSLHHQREREQQTWCICDVNKMRKLKNNQLPHI